MTIKRLAVAGVALLVAVMPVAGAIGEDVTAEQEVSGAAVYAYPASESAPTQALGIANPSIACLFMPCPPELSDPLYYASDPVGVTEPVHGNTAPMEAVPPDSVAVGLMGGATRYESGLHFEVPALTDGQEFQSFAVQMTQKDPTYHSSSPTLRNAIDAAFVAYRTEDPAKTAAKIEQAIASEPASTAVLAVQACPFQAPFEPVETPMVASHKDIPTDDYGAPNVACHLGGFGQFDPETGVWTFDVTRAANAWASGELANNGLFLRPFITNYVGLGDEDPSTNAQVTFDATSVTVVATSAKASGGFVITPPPPIVPPAQQDQGQAPPVSGDDQTSNSPALFPDVVAPPVGTVPQTAPQPVPAPAPVPASAPSGDFAGAFAADDVSEMARIWTLLALLALGYGAHQVVSRTRPKPRLVAVDSALSTTA
jgi:hypothetical protein